jgi:hypothetical protein
MLAAQMLQLRKPDCPLVVATDKQNWCTKDSCKVQSSRGISLTGSTLMSRQQNKNDVNKAQSIEEPKAPDQPNPLQKL